MAPFRLTREAIDDVDAIWLHIYRSNPKAADAVDEEIRAAYSLLGPSQAPKLHDCL
jgi:plasmid stabilization system protein ParE